MCRVLIANNILLIAFFRKGNEAAIQLILSAIEKAGYAPGKDIFLAIDAASSEFYADGKMDF